MPLPKDIQNHFKNFPVTSLWRLFIDKNRQKDVGPAGFDKKEPGYLQGIMDGFDYAVQNLNKPLTAEFLIELHDTGILPVKYKRESYGTKGIEDTYQDFDAGVRNDVVEFGLVYKDTNQNFTKAGVKELLQKLADGDSRFKIKLAVGEYITKDNIKTPITDEYVNDIMGKLTQEGELADAAILRTQRSREAIKKSMHEIIDAYQKTISQPNLSEDEKITAIATCVHELELLHPFFDANCRTFCISLLYKLLLEQGFPPALVENPNRFDAYSIAELKQEIKDGIAYFRKLQAADKPLAGHEHEPLIYFNDTTTLLIVLQTTAQCANWDKINPDEKEKAITIIQTTLKKLADQGLNYDDLTKVMQIIKENLGDAIYKKSFYQVSVLKKPNEYGIHFDNFINRQMKKHIFDSAHLQQKIQDVITPSHALK